VKIAHTFFWRLRISLRATPLRRIWVWRRHLGLDATDTFLACYPRSGSNWLQFLLYQSLTNLDPTFEAARAFSPYLGSHRHALRLLPGGRRLLKTHEPYQPIYRKAILLIRDPRDVVLSDYRFLRMRGDFGGDFGQFLTEFIAGRAHGFGSWRDHVESWLNSGLAEENLHIVRYEDLSRETPSRLSSVLEFLGVNGSALDLEAICGNNTVERMRMKEELGLGAPRTRSPRYRFVNRGLVGGWSDDLTPSQIEQLEQAFQSTMIRSSYLPRRNA